MDISTFISNYREAFGERAELPIAFWYSDSEVYPTEKVAGCMFKTMPAVRAGRGVSLSAETIGCGGGKFYTGFEDLSDFMPNFVSLKEKYKQTPQMVIDLVNQIGVSRTDKKYLNFARLDTLETFDGIEALMFLATPDILSGLTTWAFFDSNAPDAVSAPFGSGCCSIVTMGAMENRMGGKRTFLGLFDPSVRPFFEPDMLSFTIPMSRFAEMYHTMRASCLFDTHAWSKIKTRIEGE
jgi:hypothetical protein